MERKLSQEEFCKAILACQNDNMITETGILSLLKNPRKLSKCNEALVIIIASNFYGYPHDLAS